MRLPISDQQQPNLYLAPFSYNTSVTVDCVFYSIVASISAVKVSSLLADS